MTEHEVEADDAAVLQQGAQSDIMLVMPVAEIDACRTSDLTGDIIHAVHRTGGYADGTLKIQSRLHECVKDTGGVHAAECAALQNDAARSDAVISMTGGEIFQTGVIGNNAFDWK